MSLPSVVSFLGNEPIQRRRRSLIRGVSPGQDQIVEEVDKVKGSKCQTKRDIRQEGSVNLVNKFDQEDAQEYAQEDAQEGLNEVAPYHDRVTQVRKISSFKQLPSSIISLIDNCKADYTNQIIKKESVYQTNSLYTTFQKYILLILYIK